MELVSEAIIFAVKAHDGMRRRKGDAPYVLHPMEAAVIVGSMSDACSEAVVSHCSVPSFLQQGSCIMFRPGLLQSTVSQCCLFC